jgi:uncharacterized membrane protein YfcA
MSESIRTAGSNETSLTNAIINASRHYLRGRRRWILLGVAAVSAGAFFSWGWLVAIGLAPLLIALAPCAVMCGLGLCMMRGKSCSSESSSGNQNPGTEALSNPTSQKSRES